MLNTFTSITLTPRSRGEDANVTKASLTPSPNAVQDFRNTAITNSNTSDIVSDAIYEQLGVVVTDSEVIEYSSALALPELTEAYEQAEIDANCIENDLDVSEDETNKWSSRSRGSSTKTQPVGQRMLQQALSSLATPVTTDTDYFTDQIDVGNEREVLFYASSLGITLNRGIDGYVRVVSATKVGDDQVRDGDIFAGDIVREVNDVDLRVPIDMAIWKMTIALMKMAPRPLRMILAEELTGQDVVVEEVNAESPSTTSNVIEGDDKKCRGARAFRHLMNRSPTIDSNVTYVNTNKGEQPTLEELSEEQLKSIELDHSRDASDDFDDCMLTKSQINNLL